MWLGAGPASSLSRRGCFHEAAPYRAHRGSDWASTGRISYGAMRHRLVTNTFTGNVGFRCVYHEAP